MRVELGIGVDLLHAQRLSHLGLIGHDTRSRVVAVIVPASSTLDMDDFGAVMREQARRPRTYGLPGEIENAHTAEHTGTGS
jgi:hypothetical protein